MSLRDEIEALVQGREGFVFAGADVRALTGPIVYLLLRAGRVLYIGLSRNGWARIDNHHHVLGGLDILDADTLQIWPLDTLDEAERLEHLLIMTLKPELNQRRFHDRQLLRERLGMTSSGVTELIKRLPVQNASGLDEKTQPEGSA